MKIFRGGGLISIGFFFFLSPLWAEPQIQVRLEPSRTLKVGESCHFTLQISWKNSEANYSFTSPDLILEKLAIEERGEANEVFQKNGEEWKKKTFLTDLKALKAGNGKIHPFTLTYVDPVTQGGGHFDIAGKEIKISPDRSGLYRGILFGIGLLSLGTFLAKWFLSRRKKFAETGAGPPVQSLEEQFLSNLSRLKESRESDYLPEAGKIFRNYLDQKSQGEGVLSTDEMKTLKIIFDRLDEWRYADMEKSRENERYLCDEMIRFIENKK